MKTNELPRYGVRQMRRLDLLAFLIEAFPRADHGKLGLMGRDRLLTWASEQAG